MRVLVLADHDGESLKPATLSAVAAAGKFAATCDLLVMGGESARAVADLAARVMGVAKVRLVCAESWQHASAEAAAPLVAELAADYDAGSCACGEFCEELASACGGIA